MRGAYAHVFASRWCSHVYTYTTIDLGKPLKNGLTSLYSKMCNYWSQKGLSLKPAIDIGLVESVILNPRILKHLFRLSIIHVLSITCTYKFLYGQDNSPNPKTKMVDLQFQWINANMLLLSYDMWQHSMGPRDNSCQSFILISCYTFLISQKSSPPCTLSLHIVSHAARTISTL